MGIYSDPIDQQEFIQFPEPCPPATPGARRVAVVLIHGMGEQRPMETLRPFVQKYVSTHNQNHSKGQSDHQLWSIPDRVDSTFELHSYTVPASPGREGEPQDAQMDFYEGYWAQQMQGTKFVHIWNWLRQRVLRGEATRVKIPARLHIVLWTLILVMAMFAVSIGIFTFNWIVLGWDKDWGWHLIRSAAVLLLGLMGALLAKTFGDVTRYVDNSLENVAVREAVREGTVGLLEKLHDSGRYSRIVVIGHSLGGIVAYDALRLLWSRRVRDRDLGSLDDTALAVAAKKLTDAANNLDDDSEDLPQDYRQLLEDFWREQASLQTQLAKGSAPIWLISDLLTVGSPVAYPDLFITRPGSTLKDLIDEREVATCPPQFVRTLDGRPTTSFCYASGPTINEKEKRVFHHGAVFAPTRWTNVYAGNDLAGNSIPRQDVGPGVRNWRWGPAVKSPGLLATIRSHNNYWAENDSQCMRQVIDDVVKGTPSFLDLKQGGHWLREDFGQDLEIVVAARILNPRRRG